MPDFRTAGQPDGAIRAALRQSAASRPLGFFFDFDGVLAPIQDEPDQARPVAGAIGLLQQLAVLADKVGIISARPVSFLARHFGSASRISLYGLYGLEARVNGVTQRNSTAASWEPAIRELTAAARRELPPAVRIEEKPMSVALHYRSSPQHRQAVEEWARAAAETRGVARQDGRMVVELKPPVAVDKGTVLALQAAALECAWYFGDDLSDAKAFAALRAQQEQRPGFRGVCVAVENAEIGGILEKQADFVLAEPAAIPALLAAAIETLAPER
jgi:trehalose 6-phosphate phosphatase